MDAYIKALKDVVEFDKVYSVLSPAIFEVLMNLFKINLWTSGILSGVILI
jgi:hypothetical protein